MRESDATLLAVAFDVVEERLARRNTHQAAFATYPDGAALFDTLMASIYDDAEDVNTCCGVSRSKLAEIIEAQNLKWCDPDEAFDDGTTLFHFDGATIPRPFATCGWMRMNFIGCFKNGGTPFSQNGAEQTKYP